MQTNTISAGTFARLLGELPPDTPVVVSCDECLFAVWDSGIGRPEPIVFRDGHDNAATIDVSIITLPGVRLGLAA